jgi:hypothetical protein
MPMLLPLSNTNADTIAKTIIQNWIPIFGFPKSIHSDRGSNFESKLFAEILQFFRIKKTKSTPYYPQGDGIVERLFGTVKPLLKTMTSELGKEWNDCLPWINMALRNSKTNTRYSPNEIIFGRNMTDAFVACDNSPYNHTLNCNSYVKKMREIIIDIREKISKQFPIMKLQPNQVSLKIGDNYMVRIMGTKSGQQLYKGPYQVVKIIGHNAARLKNIENEEIIERNIKHLKKCHHIQNNNKKTYPQKENTSQPVRYGFQKQ